MHTAECRLKQIWSTFGVNKTHGKYWYRSSWIFNSWFFSEVKPETDLGQMLQSAIHAKDFAELYLKQGTTKMDEWILQETKLCALQRNPICSCEISFTSNYMWSWWVTPLKPA